MEGSGRTPSSVAGDVRRRAAPAHIPGLVIVALLSCDGGRSPRGTEGPSPDDKEHIGAAGQLEKLVRGQHIQGFTRPARTHETRAGQGGAGCRGRQRTDVPARGVCLFAWVGGGLVGVGVLLLRSVCVMGGDVGGDCLLTYGACEDALRSPCSWREWVASAGGRRGRDWGRSCLVPVACLCTGGGGRGRGRL